MRGTRADAVEPLVGELGGVTRYPDRTFAFVDESGIIDTDMPAIRYQSVVTENMPGEGQGGAIWPNATERGAMFDIANRRPTDALIATPKDGPQAGNLWWTVSEGTLIRMQATSIAEAVIEDTHTSYVTPSNVIISQSTT